MYFVRIFTLSEIRTAFGVKNQILKFLFLPHAKTNFKYP